MSPQSSIGHYRITAKLGKGGMGAVYRATDTKLNREVAIKVMPPVFAQDPDRMARFEREALVLASPNHPNIASIHGVEDCALVMELVEGPTLAYEFAQHSMQKSEWAKAYYNHLRNDKHKSHQAAVGHSRSNGSESSFAAGSTVILTTRRSTCDLCAGASYFLVPLRYRPLESGGKPSLASSFDSRRRHSRFRSSVSFRFVPTILKLWARFLLRWLECHAASAAGLAGSRFHGSSSTTRLMG
jgi:hypothetical protein